MAKQISKVSTTVMQLNSSAEIDKNDIIAIAVSRAETALNATVKQYTTSAKDADKQADGILKELHARIEREATANYKQSIDNIAAELSAFEPVNVTLSFNHNLPNATTVTLTINKHANINYPWTAATKIEVAGPDLDRYVELRAAAVADREQAVNARRQLASINTLERQIRAKLAEQTLMGIDGGEALIEAITGDLDARIKSLPS